MVVPNERTPESVETPASFTWEGLKGNLPQHQLERIGLLRAARDVGGGEVPQVLRDLVLEIATTPSEEHKSKLADILVAIGIPFETPSAPMSTTPEASKVVGAPEAQMGQTRPAAFPVAVEMTPMATSQSVQTSEVSESTVPEAAPAVPSREEILARFQEINGKEGNPQRYMAALSEPEGSPGDEYAKKRAKISKAFADGAEPVVLLKHLEEFERAARNFDGNVSVAEAPQPEVAAAPLPVAAPIVESAKPALQPVVPAETTSDASAPASTPASAPGPVVKLGTDGNPVGAEKVVPLATTGVTFGTAAASEVAPTAESPVHQVSSVKQAAEPVVGWSHLVEEKVPPAPEAPMSVAEPQVPVSAPEVSAPITAVVQEVPVSPVLAAEQVSPVPPVAPQAVEPAPAAETRELNETVLREEVAAVVDDVFAGIPSEHRAIVVEAALPLVANDNQHVSPAESLPPRADTGTLAAQPPNNAFVADSRDKYRAAIDEADMVGLNRTFIGTAPVPRAVNDNLSGDTEALRKAA